VTNLVNGVHHIESKERKRFLVFDAYIPPWTIVRGREVKGREIKGYSNHQFIPIIKKTKVLGQDMPSLNE